MTKIKVCGLSRHCDIAYVNEAMPDYCGFIINFPKSRRNVTPEQVRALRRDLAEEIAPVGVFVDRPAEEIAELLNDGTLAAAQLHGHEDEAYLAALRKLTGGMIVQAFQVRTSADALRAESSSADFILLDSGQGSGETFDWSILREVQRPYFLAGGLTPDNIPTAAAQCRPYAVDLSSGVETEGFKDRKKILAAVAAAKGKE